MLKKDREQTTPIDKYPWLDPEDEKRNMTDREILEKYVDLRNSWMALALCWFSVWVCLVERTVVGSGCLVGLFEGDPFLLQGIQV